MTPLQIQSAVYGVFLVMAIVALAICCLAGFLPEPRRRRNRRTSLARILRFSKGGDA